MERDLVTDNQVVQLRFISFELIQRSDRVPWVFEYQFSGQFVNETRA